MVDQLTSWQPDPWGIHEMRFFSAEGKPTQLVMDGGRTSYDKPPPTPPPVHSSPLSPEPESSPVHGASVGSPDARFAPEPPASTGVPREARNVIPPVIEFADNRSRFGADDRSPPTLSRPRKIAYIVVCAALALSVLGLAYVHLRPTGSGNAARAAAPTTTSSAPRTTTTTTIALPSALQAEAEAAATALVSSWSTGNKATALTVATPTAVAALFASKYTSGLATDRGCSTAFTPIVCTFGPPGGASPTDPIYQIDVTKAAGGWYVSAVKIQN
jgi:hypothetical protein